MNEPRTLTEAISRVKQVLLPLTWTSKIHDRAFIQSRQTVGQDKAQLLPMIHVGAGEYIDGRPNDEYKSVLFFVAAEVEKNDFNRAKHSPTHAIRAERPVSIIGWVNLELTETDPESIKISLKRALKYVGCVIRIGDYQDNPISAVYRPFVVSDLDRKYDRWPYHCFRQEITLMTIEL